MLQLFFFLSRLPITTTSRRTSAFPGEFTSEAPEPLRASCYLSIFMPCFPEPGSSEYFFHRTHPRSFISIPRPQGISFADIEFQPIAHSKIVDAAIYPVITLRFAVLQTYSKSGSNSSKNLQPRWVYFETGDNQFSESVLIYIHLLILVPGTLSRATQVPSSSCWPPDTFPALVGHIGIDSRGLISQSDPCIGDFCPLWDLIFHLLICIFLVFRKFSTYQFLDQKIGSKYCLRSAV